jgi:hypothetical protein
MDGIPKVITPRFHDRERGVFLDNGRLNQDFDRPILAIGFVNDQIGRRIGTKNDWYCLCLFSDAFHLRTEHPIFNGPFDVKMTMIDKPTPEGIFSFPHQLGGHVPETLPMWRVQTYESTQRDESAPHGRRVGLVARPGGYEDSPEAEFISGGHSTKSPFAVAIGRHGNFFHWGFAASPDYMTKEAKPVLANAIVYISKFAGQTPIARKFNDRVTTRGWLADRKNFMSREYFEINEKQTATWNERITNAQEKQARGEELTDAERQMASMRPQQSMTFEQHVERMVGMPALFEKFGADIDAIGRYFDENYNYFYWTGSMGLEVDEDAKSLGIANNDKRILDEAIKMLETGRDAAKGRRILERYTLLDFATPAEWRRWYNTNQNNLFFTESGGWFFLVNSREPGVNDYRAHEKRMLANRVPAGKTDDMEPVAITAEWSVMQDGNHILNIKINVHPRYYIYDHVASADPFTAAEVVIYLPEGYSKVGRKERPSGQFYNQRGTTIFRDAIVFSQEFTGSGAGELKYKVIYQCCDSNICFPPEEKTYVLKLN